MQMQLIQLANEIGQLLRANNAKLAIAESCTGGGLCQLMTEVAGSSAWFDCGFVCYSNLSKIKMLGVNPHTLETFGAVSAETALEMSAGALQKSGADYAVSITGIAGPDGGSVEKPVGIVFIALQTGQTACCYPQHFQGTRAEIRQKSLVFALEQLQQLLFLKA